MSMAGTQKASFYGAVRGSSFPTTFPLLRTPRTPRLHSRDVRPPRLPNLPPILPPLPHLHLFATDNNPPLLPQTPAINRLFRRPQNRHHRRRAHWDQCGGALRIPRQQCRDLRANLQHRWNMGPCQQFLWVTNSFYYV